MQLSQTVLEVAAHLGIKVISPQSLKEVGPEAFAGIDPKVQADLVLACCMAGAHRPRRQPSGSNGPSAPLVKTQVASTGGHYDRKCRRRSPVFRH